MTPQQFAAKWKASTLKESSAAQEHFIDLCRLLGEQTPAEADPEGSWFCFERGAKKTGGGEGWADVWRRGCFAWEYKGKHKDLSAAFVQLQRYAIALENPPLLVVSDMDSIFIYTNFTNTVQEVHAIPIDELDKSDNLRKLKWLFTDPERLRPGTTTTAITEAAASKFAALAAVLRGRGIDPQRVAHFLNRLLFCLFAEDAGLLPPRLVVRLLEAGLKHPAQANDMLKGLFAAMTKGGLFGADLIEWFNGGLFDDDDTIPLEPDDIKEVLSVARLDWSAIEPSVFGTLFERGLDPGKRAQLGAHYTDPQSIMRIVKPVVIDPLEAEWLSAKTAIESALEKVKAVPVLKKGKKQTTKPKALQQAEELYTTFLHRLSQFRALDPACGSGNFLYLALQALKDLELRVMLESEQLGLHAGFVGMNVGVQCVCGIELNTYAAELARVTVWIGEIQWMLRHGVPPSKNPILKPLHTIECRDALLTDDGKETDWPAADVIIGNPPFLGNKRMLSELGEEYTERLRRVFKDCLPGGVDLVIYWFEKSRAMIEAGKAKRAGLVATQSIRKGANRTVLDAAVKTAPIFEAWSDQPWVNEGADVRVSLVAFGIGGGLPRLDGAAVAGINPDLTPAVKGLELMLAKPLSANSNIAFQGPVKVGAFDIPGATARAWIASPNPHGKSNADVLRPWANGQDITGRPSDTWIIDFGASRTQADAALYEKPFEHVRMHVKPARDAQRDEGRRTRWWLHGRTGEDLRAAMAPLKRYIATSRVAKHRFFVWLPVSVWPDSRLFAICRDDDFTFGVLSSRFHVIWALAQASRHGVGNDPTYNARDCFETFPFPTAESPGRAAAEAAARKLDELRQQWLNPPEWIELLPEVVPSYPARIRPRPGHEDELKKRTLTNLYNARPVWLETAHQELDAAIAVAYGWKDYTPAISDEEVLSRLLALNLSRTASTKSPQPQLSEADSEA